MHVPDEVLEHELRIIALRSLLEKGALTRLQFEEAVAATLPSPVATKLQSDPPWVSPPVNPGKE